MSEVESVTGLKDKNESESITSVTGRELIRPVAVGVLRLPWRLFLLPISVIGGSVGLVTGSVRLSFRVADSVLSYWLRMVRLTSSSRNRKPSSTALVSASVSTTAEASEAEDFLSEFESRYGEIHPNFAPGGFMDAVELSRRECKLLFVYLHSPDNPDTTSFCIETLCSEFLSAFVNENFVSWGDSIRKNDGLEISKSLNASRFPFWAVIKGATATGEGFSLLRQFERPSSAEEMVTELKSVLKEIAPSLVGASVDSTDEHTTSSPLMEEEDAPCSVALETNLGNEFQREEDQNEIETEAESEAKMCEEENPLSVTEPDPEPGPGVLQFEGTSSPEEMVTELQSVLEENDRAFDAASIDTTDEHTNNPPLMEEEDAPYPAALEADQGKEFHREENQNGIETEAESEAKLCEEEASLLVVEPDPEPGPDVLQFEGPSSPEEMITELHSVIEENNRAFDAASVDTTDEHTNNPPLMEEEDAPYPAALEVDQADELQTEEDQNGKEPEAESDAKLCEEPKPEPEPVIEVFVRLPIGENIGRSFPCTATLQSVYDFVDSSGWLDVGSYTLVTFFPRLLYGQHQLSSTLEELGLNPQTSLFVELNY